MLEMDDRTRVALMAQAMATFSAARITRVHGTATPARHASRLATVAQIRRRVWAAVRPICGKCWAPAVRREVDSIGELYAYCGRCWEVVKHVYCD